MSLMLEKRRDRTNNYYSHRRLRRTRSFRSRIVRLASEMGQGCDDVKSGEGSSTSSTSSLTVCSMNLTENFMVPMESHGEKVRSLIKMLGQQRELFDPEQVQRSPIMQLQARRLRSLFALARHFDSKSNSAESAPPPITTQSDCISSKEPEQQKGQIERSSSQKPVIAIANSLAWLFATVRPFQIGGFWRIPGQLPYGATYLAYISSTGMSRDGNPFSSRWNRDESQVLKAMKQAYW